nr:addiction module protein [Bacteroidota bacterium]
MNKTAINKMPIKERIILMEELWESLRKERKDIESPDWHNSTLSERRKQIAIRDASYITIEELKRKPL